MLFVARFRQECKAAGKQIMVWTVNDPACMMEAVRWDVAAILTDVTKTWLDLRAALQGTVSTSFLSSPFFVLTCWCSKFVS